jgi:hypothetical protein
MSRSLERLKEACRYAESRTGDEESVLREACRLDVPPRLPSPSVAAEVPVREVYEALVIEHLAKGGYTFAELYKSAQATTIWKSLSAEPGPPEVYGSLVQQRNHAKQVINECRAEGYAIGGEELRDQLAATMYKTRIDIYRKHHKGNEPSEVHRPVVVPLDSASEFERKNKGSGKSFWS